MQNRPRLKYHRDLSESSGGISYVQEKGVWRTLILDSAPVALETRGETQLQEGFWYALALCQENCSILLLARGYGVDEKWLTWQMHGWICSSLILLTLAVQESFSVRGRAAVSNMPSEIQKVKLPPVVPYVFITIKLFRVLLQKGMKPRFLLSSLIHYSSSRLIGYKWMKCMLCSRHQISISAVYKGNIWKDTFSWSNTTFLIFLKYASFVSP